MMGRRVWSRDPLRRPAVSAQPVTWLNSAAVTSASVPDPPLQSHASFFFSSSSSFTSLLLQTATPPVLLSPGSGQSQRGSAFFLGQSAAGSVRRGAGTRGVSCRVRETKKKNRGSVKEEKSGAGGRPVLCLGIPRAGAGGHIDEVIGRSRSDITMPSGGVSAASWSPELEEIRVRLAAMGPEEEEDDMPGEDGVPASVRRKSVNTNELVPVPSSEHVAEIVGRQGECMGEV